MNPMNTQRFITSKSIKEAAKQLEEEYRKSLPEEADMMLAHVSNSLLKKSKSKRYDKSKCNGFTIVVVNQDGKYFYQASICSLEDKFDRAEGRRVLFAKLLADNPEFDLIEVPQSAFKFYPEHLHRRAVIDHFITTVINRDSGKKQTGQVKWNILQQKELVARLESVVFAKLLPFLPVPSRLTYLYSEDGRKTVLKVIPYSTVSFEDDNHKEDVKEQLKVFEVSSKCHEEDNPNRYIGRFMCLKKLIETLNK